MAKKILGIDEAGRGALIGPLVICGALISEGKLNKLKELQVRDSKLLSPTRRVELSFELKKELDSFEIIRTGPEEIDAKRKSGTNLNNLEAQKMASIINNFEPDKVYIDAVDSNIQTFTRRLSPNLRVDTKLIAEHEADVKYPIVSAASILAKVERDSDIEELKGIYGENLGSGYPSDPITINFLKDWLKRYKSLPKIVRKTWSTVSEAVSSEKQKSLEEWLETE